MARADAGGVLSRRSLATMATMLASIMQTVDSTIANVALPRIQGTMSATTEQAAWVLTSYVIATAIATAPAGYIANRFGRRQLFIVSVAGFTVVSVLCGLATSIGELVLFRILQGVFGAALVPMSQAVLLDTYPPHRYGQAMALWGTGIMLGPILGPTLGGYITEWLDWRWVFFINLPLGALTLLGLALFVDESPRQDRAPPFDWTGFVFLGLAIGALQLMLDRGHTLDWFDSREIIVEAIVAALFFYLATVHMLTSRTPLVSLALFRDRNYATGLIAIFFLGLLMLATMALLPPFLETLLGYPVDLVGEVMAPRGIGTMISMMVVGRLTASVDPRLLVSVGFAITATALWRMTQFTLDITPWQVLHTGFLQGLGLGLIMVPLASMSYATLPAALRNDAVALFSLLRNVGGSFGLSLVIAMLSSRSQLHHAQLAEQINAAELQTLVAQWQVQAGQGLLLLEDLIAREARMLAFLDDFRLVMLLSLLMVPAMLLMRRPPPVPAQARLDAGALVE